MVTTAYLKDKAAVERLNQVACQQAFDMSVSCGTTMIDAKSLLALFTLIGKKVFIVAPDELNPRYFAKMVKKMQLA